MKYLLILDLAGTLIESIHITSRLNDNGNGLYGEYYSRINCIGRKLNNFLENNNNRVVILSSFDHGPYQNLEMVMKDINSIITEGNRERIEYYVSYSEICCTMDNGNQIIGVSTKDVVYDNLLSTYRGYYPIAIDDRPSVDNYLKVLKNGGQCIFIKNELYSFSADYNSMEILKKRFHLDDDIDRLIGYFSRASVRFSHQYESYEEMPEFYKFSVDDTYRKLNNGDLNIEELYNWLKLTDIKHLFFAAGYSIETIEELIKHNCIAQYPSFEMAYQKILLPKITRTTEQ